jgi:hypothetical protein
MFNFQDWQCPCKKVLALGCYPLGIIHIDPAKNVLDGRARKPLTGSISRIIPMISPMRWSELWEPNDLNQWAGGTPGEKLELLGQVRTYGTIWTSTGYEADNSGECFRNKFFTFPALRTRGIACAGPKAPRNKLGIGPLINRANRQSWMANPMKYKHLCVLAKNNPTKNEKYNIYIVKIKMENTN